MTADVGTACGGTQYQADIPLVFVGDIDRIAGSDRYVTAQQISQQFPPVNSRHVVIARR